MNDSITPSTAHAHRPFAARMLGAARLDVSTYEEVEADRSATGQAATVVALAAAASAIGAWGQGSGGIIAAIVSALLSWAVSAGLAYFVGTRFFGGTADWGELLRTLGFAQAPRLLNVLGIIPGLGRLVMVIVAVWVLVAQVIAIRQALDVDTGKAILTAVVATLIALIPVILLTGLAAITALLVS